MGTIEIGGEPRPPSGWRHYFRSVGFTTDLGGSGGSGVLRRRRDFFGSRALFGFGGVPNPPPQPPAPQVGGGVGNSGGSGGLLRGSGAMNPLWLVVEDVAENHIHALEFIWLCGQRSTRSF